MSPQRLAILAVVALTTGLWSLAAAEPPVQNPFGQTPPKRDDAVRGRIELSNGTIHSGLIYLTRDKRLHIFDEAAQRMRDVPLNDIKQIDCRIKKEWMEKEWRFKETTSDEKIHTGREYPAREYLHTITLKDGRTITGPLSAVVYIESSQGGKPKIERCLLNNRNKGELGNNLESLLYVKRIKLDVDAVKKKDAKPQPSPLSPEP
jgi:hypothetical protein